MDHMGSFFGEDPFSLIATWEGTNLDEFGSDSGVRERGSHSVATEFSAVS